MHLTWQKYFIHKILVAQVPTASPQTAHKYFRTIWTLVSYECDHTLNGSPGTSSWFVTVYLYVVNKCLEMSIASVHS